MSDRLALRHQYRFHQRIRVSDKFYCRVDDESDPILNQGQRFFHTFVASQIVNFLVHLSHVVCKCVDIGYLLHLQLIWSQQQKLEGLVVADFGAFSSRKVSHIFEMKRYN